MEKIINSIEKISIDRTDFEYDNEMATVYKKNGGYLFEFVLRYEKIIKNKFSRSYDRPEECDIDFQVVDVESLDVYGFRNVEVELTTDQLEELENILKNMLIGKKY